MKLFLDIISGISGDMFLSLLLGFNDVSEELSELVSDILDDKVEIYLQKKKVNGILCNKLVIKENAKKVLRHYHDIKLLLESAPIPEKCKEDSLSVLKLIAEAEAKVHNCSVEKIHFHEVGAVDTIVDVVGVAYLINFLQIDEVLASPVKVGYGVITTEHGRIPVPAPATAEILKGLEVERVNVEDEITTPTGAALYRYFVKKIRNTFHGKLHGISYSTGVKEFDEIPNMLRGFLLDCESYQLLDLIDIEFNIDDDTGENLGFLMEKFFDAGAVDVFFTPIFMKKNRPAYKMNVLCDEELLENMIKTAFEISSTLGLRFSTKRRVVMDRREEIIRFMGEEIRIKKAFFGDVEKVSIEWEDLKKLSEKMQLSPVKLRNEILKSLNL